MTLGRFDEPPTPTLCRTCDTPTTRDGCPYCDGLHYICDHNGKVWHKGDLDECRRELAHLIINHRDAYFTLFDPLDEPVEQGGNREML